MSNEQQPSAEQAFLEADVPLWVGAGTSNEVWTVPGTGEVQRRSYGDVDALDLRVVNDTDVRSALRFEYANVYTAGTPLNQQLADSAGLPRLRHHGTNPSSSEATFHEVVGHMIDELAYISHHSESAARALLPKARRSVEIFRSLPEESVPLRCAADVGDSGLMRAFAVRVAEVVTPVIGERAASRFGLPTPQRIARDLAHPYDDRSRPVVAHGDPIVGNLMWAGAAPVLIDWDLARPAGEISAAAQTLAALVTRAPYPLRPERIEQYLNNVAGARKAVDSGLYATYYEYEVARSAFSDVMRGLLGKTPPELVHRNVKRFLGDNAPSLPRVKALLKAHGDGDLLSPVLPRQIRDHVVARQPKHEHPAGRFLAVEALRDEAVDAAAATLPPEVSRRYRDFLAMMARILPPPPGSALKEGERLRDAGATEVSAHEYSDRMTYRFTRPPSPGKGSDFGRHSEARRGPGLEKRKRLDQGD